MQRLLVLGVLFLGLCGCGENPPSEPETGVGVSIGMTCGVTGSDETATDQVYADVVNSCVYHRDSQTLYVDLSKSGSSGAQVRVAIGGFTGPGTYLTENATDPSTYVTLDGSKGQCHGDSFISMEDCPGGQDGVCTINVTETDLHLIDVSSETRGSVSLNVSCGPLFGFCDGPEASDFSKLNPGTFEVRAPDCVAGE